MASGYTYNDGSTCTCGSNRDSGSTQFGACYDATSHAMTCSISDNDCAPGETWLDPQEALLSHGFECPCEAVETGACHNAVRAEMGATNANTCAVDTDSCDAGETFISARDARDTYGMLCVLCSSPAPLPTPAPTSPTPAPTVLAKKQPKKSGGPSTTVVLSITGPIIVILLGAIVALYLKNQAKPRPVTPAAVVQVRETQMSVVQAVPLSSDLKA